MKKPAKRRVWDIRLRYYFLLGGGVGDFFAWLKSDPATDFCAGVLFLFDSCLLASDASFFPVAIVTSNGWFFVLRNECKVISACQASIVYPLRISAN